MSDIPRRSREFLDGLRYEGSVVRHLRIIHILNVLRHTVAMVCDRSIRETSGKLLCGQSCSVPVAGITQGRFERPFLHS